MTVIGKCVEETTATYNKYFKLPAFKFTDSGLHCELGYNHSKFFNSMQALEKDYDQNNVKQNDSWTCTACENGDH